MTDSRRIPMRAGDASDYADGQYVLDVKNGIYLPPRKLVDESGAPFDTSHDGQLRIDTSGGGGGGGSSAAVKALIPGAAYLEEHGVATTSTSAITPGLLTLKPLIGRGSLASLTVNTTTSGAAGLLRLGVYDSDADGYPGARLSTAGTVSNSGTGLKTATFAAPVAVDGLVWIACLNEVAGGALTMTATLAIAFLGTAPGSMTFYRSWEATGVTTGALPDPLPALALSSTNRIIVWATAA